MQGQRMKASVCANTGVCAQWACIGGIASGGFSRLGGLSQLKTADFISLHRTYCTPLPERPIGGLVAAPIVRTARHLSSQTGAIMGRRKEKVAARTQCARAATSAIASAGVVLRQQSGAVSARALLGLGVVE